MLLNILILIIHIGNKINRLTLRFLESIPISILQAVTYIIQYEKFRKIYINKFHIPKNKIVNGWNFWIFLRLNHTWLWLTETTNWSFFNKNDSSRIRLLTSKRKINCIQLYPFLFYFVCRSIFCFVSKKIRQNLYYLYYLSCSLTGILLPFLNRYICLYLSIIAFLSFVYF